MHSWIRYLTGLGLTVLLMTSMGCRESVYKVHGKVTFEGKPLPGGGSISFVPIDSESGRAAGCTIAEDGTYTLTTIKDGDGAFAGEYRVIIQQVTEKEPKNSGDGMPIEATNLSLPESERIHPKFADHYKSPLTAKVEAISSNEINFNLKRE